MKAFVFLFALFLAGSSALGQASKVDQIKLREQLRTLLQEQAGVLETTERQLGESRNTATTLYGELGKAQEQVKQVAGERDGWKAYGEDQHDKFMNAEKRVAEQKVAKLKWLGAFSGLAVLVLAYFGLKFLTPLGKFIP